MVEYFACRGTLCRCWTKIAQKLFCLGVPVENFVCKPFSIVYVAPAVHSGETLAFEVTAQTGGTTATDSIPVEIWVAD